MNDPRPPVRQIPAPPADFVGRGAEMVELDHAIRKARVRVVAIRGLGGAGKSSLAALLADWLTPLYPDAHLFVPLRGAQAEPVTPAAALAQILHALQPMEKLPDELPVLQGMYRSLLAGQRAILVLDDARDLAQVEPFLPPDDTLVLITTRYAFHLPGLHSLELDTLPCRNAVRFLRAPLAARLSEAEAEELATLCEDLPLALAVTVGALAQQPTLPASVFLTRLRDEVERLGHLARGEKSVEAALRLSYELLDSEAQARFAQLGIFPADFDREAAAAVWGRLIPPSLLAMLRRWVTFHLHRWFGLPFTPPPPVPLAPLGAGPTEAMLQRLVGARLVEWDSGRGRYRLHDLVRPFARGQLGWSEEATALRHASYFGQLLFESGRLGEGKQTRAGVICFDREQANVVAAHHWLVRHAPTDDRAARLCTYYPEMGEIPFHFRFTLPEQTEWLEAALAAARRLRLRAEECQHLCNLSVAYSRAGEMQRVVDCVEPALALARAIGDRRSEGFMLVSLGQAHDALGTPSQALACLEQSLAIARAMGDRRSEGDRLVKLGHHYQQMGEWQRAVDHYQQALAIARAIGERWGEARVLQRLGLAYGAIGEEQAALECFQQQVIVAQALGDRWGEGQALCNQGVVHVEQGRVTEALPLFEQHLALARASGDVYGEAVALLNLAEAQHKLGQREAALPRLREAIALFEAIESPDADEARATLAAWESDP